MDKILALLKTPEKAQAMKAKLKAMPESEKTKANYQKLWELVCDKVKEYEKQKNNPQKSSLKTQKEKKTVAVQAPAPAPVKTKSKKTNEPKQNSHTQPQFTKEEISSAIALLEKKYPKLFSMENPKPLKVGVFNEVVVSGDWNKQLLKKALRTYVQSKAYYLSCSSASYRYDLNGDKVGEISADNKENAILKLRELIGRFNMPEKYPDLALKGKPPTPPILRSEFYGNHYYEKVRFLEIKSLLIECYGSKIRITQRDSENNGNHQTTRIIMENDKALFEVTAEAPTKKMANKLSGVKLLVWLQNNIEAYPFAYVKSSLSEAEIEKGFLEYYKAKQ